jgi:hypothetical protein
MHLPIAGATAMKSEWKARSMSLRLPPLSQRPAPFHTRRTHHRDLDGGVSALLGDSFAPPYFMAGVGAGVPLPSDAWCVTPLSASVCPADFACAIDSAEMDSTGLPYFSAADMTYHLALSGALLAPCAASSTSLSSGDRLLKASCRPAS